VTQPWVRVDGTLNRRVLDGLLGVMLRVVMQTGSETNRDFHDYNCKTTRNALKRPSFCFIQLKISLSVPLPSHTSFNLNYLKRSNHEQALCSHTVSKVGFQSYFHN
jgi:hypothetical protein